MAIGGARYLRPTGGAKPPQVRIKEKVEPSPALVHVQMLAVFVGNANSSSIFLDIKSLNLLHYRDSPLPHREELNFPLCSAACTKPNSRIQMYKINTLCFQASVNLCRSAWSSQPQPFCTNVGMSCLHSLAAH